MKKRNIIIVAIVMVVLVVSSVGVVFAAANPARSNQTTNGTIVFNAPSGIRWNQGLGVFEVFNAAGVSHIASNKYANAVGDIKAATAAGYEIMDGLHTYNIMKDIYYEETASFNQNFKTIEVNLGASDGSSNEGILDGNGYTLFNFPFRHFGTIIGYRSTLFWHNYGTIKNLEIDFGTVELSGTVTFRPAAFTLNNYGDIIDCTVRGNMTVFTGLCYYSAFVYHMLGGRIINGTNYSTFYSDVLNSAGSGFVTQGASFVSARTSIINCINYGDMNASVSVGIIGFVGTNNENIMLSIVNCVNYGKMGGLENANRTSAGIARMHPTAFVCLVGNINHGEILANLETGVACGMLITASLTYALNAINNVNNGTLSAKTIYPLYYGIDEQIS